VFNRAVAAFVVSSSWLVAGNTKANVLHPLCPLCLCGEPGCSGLTIANRKF